MGWVSIPIAIGWLGLALSANADDWEARQRQMVKDQIEARGIRNPAVLQAMRDTPRHLFVPTAQQDSAYEDRPLPIGYRQTISQPYIVASMTELLDIQKHHKVLEIGTGSGYQTAILSRLAGSVFSIELIQPLADDAAARLARMGYRNVNVKQGDGYQGWPEEAPFDRVIVTAAPPELPRALVDQLRKGGRLVAPVGRAEQELIVLDKDEKGNVRKQTKYPVIFVPMIPGKD